MTDHRKTAVYIRLSAEDDNVDGRAKKESDSVTSQRILLKSFAIDELGVAESDILEYVDDGVSGTHFKRQGFQQLQDDMKSGEIGCVVVKDFSRFGRDYIGVGDYLEQSSKVQAACPWYPPTDTSKFQYQEAEQCAASSESLLLGFNVMKNPEKGYENSPVSKVTKEAPPFLIIHGTNDRTVPFSQSESLYESLEKNGCDVTFLALEGADHADLQFFQDEVWERMISFFKEKLTRICEENIKN